MSSSIDSATPDIQCAGFELVYRLFSVVTRVIEKQQHLRSHADRRRLLSETDAEDLALKWLQFVATCKPLPSSRDTQALMSKMHGRSSAENKYWNLLLKGARDNDCGWEIYLNNCKPPLITLLRMGECDDQEFLDFLAMAFALAAGQKNEDFQMESNQIRSILMFCLKHLDMLLGYSLPEELDVRASEDSEGFSELQEYLAFCIAQVLYSRFAWEAVPQTSSLEKAIKAIGDFREKYCLPEISRRPGGLVSRLWERNQMLAEIRNALGSMYQQLRRCRIGDFDGYLDQVFEMPILLSIDDRIESKQLLDRDNNAILKQFLYGGKIGKSTLMRIVALTTAAGHPFLSGFFADGSESLGIMAQKLYRNVFTYFPLVLDGAKADTEAQDLISEAVRQLCDMLQIQSAQRCGLVRQLFEQQIRDKHLLLMIDNWEQAPAGIRHAVYQLGRDYHILIISNHLRRSEILRMKEFDYSRISGFYQASKQYFVENFTNDPVFYCNQMDRNQWILKPFFDTPAGLLLLMSGRDTSWDTAITREIHRQLDRLEMPGDISVAFFRWLAVSSLERAWPDADPHCDQKIIPGNLMCNSQYHKDIGLDPQQANQVWDRACQRRVLICNADVPMGFQFQYAVFRHSLAADFYLERLLADPKHADSAIERLCRMGVDDFIRIVIFMVHRLCGIEAENGGDCSGKKLEALYTLCKATSEYAKPMEGEDAYKCCLALENILRGDYSRNLLSICNTPDRPLLPRQDLPNCRMILLQCYAQLYERAADIDKLSVPKSLARSEWESWMI